MNKRIKELTEQAGFVRFSPEEDPHTPIDWSSDYTYELEKFAELIVRECVIRAEREWIRNGSDTEHNKAITSVIKSIKEHFGVES